MQKIIMFLLVVITGVVFAGCSNSPTVPQTNELTSSATGQETSNILSEISSNSTESKEETKVKYAEIIPKPEEYFKQGDITVVDEDGGKAYIFQVRNFQDGEYEAYVAKCKEMGFSDISYESENDGGKMFGAYTEDGTYWVEVLLGNDNGILAVTCKESTKK